MHPVEPIRKLQKDRSKSEHLPNFRIYTYHIRDQTGRFHRRRGRSHGPGITLQTHHLPQVVEANIPLPMDVAGELLLYDKSMTRVFLADAQREERSALRLLLLDLKMEVVGEAADWSTTLAQAPISKTELLLVDWNLLPIAPTAALEKLREACPAALVIVLISHLDARQQAALSAGADAFISKGEMPERVAERLRAAATSIDINLYPMADRKNLKN